MAIKVFFFFYWYALFCNLIKYWKTQLTSLFVIFCFFFNHAPYILPMLSDYIGSAVSLAVCRYLALTSRCQQECSFLIGLENKPCFQIPKNYCKVGFEIWHLSFQSLLNCKYVGWRQRHSFIFLNLIMAERLACPRNLNSCAEGSVATDRISQVRPVDGWWLD